MNFDFKSVNIYVDKMNNIFAVPTGISNKHGGAIMEINKVQVINSPYTDNQIEELLISALDQCFTLIPDENSSQTPLEKYLSIKGYSKAVKDKKLIKLSWNDEDGYFITPTEKIPRRGYVHLKKERIDLGNNIIDCNLANAVKEGIKKSKS